MKKLKRILALLVVVFLVSLYVATLVVSLIDSQQQGNMLKACIYSTVVIPIFLWGYALVYRVLKNKKQQELFEDYEEETISEITKTSEKAQMEDPSK